MRTFEFEGLREGKKVKGTVEAQDRAEAISRIRTEGIVPLSVKERRRFRFDAKIFRRVSEEDLALTLLQIQVLLEAGVPLTEALDLVSRQVKDERISSALSGIKADVERGDLISSAFRRAGIFPEFLPEMLAVAETGENLEVVFRMAGDHMRTVAEMKGRILNAVTYPAVVILMSLVALFVAVRFVVPRIAAVLEGMGRDLPFITKAVLLFADLLTYMIYVLPGIAVLLVLRRRIVSRERLDALILRLPVIGSVQLYFDLSRFAYTLHMTLSSAVPIVSAFKSATASISNTLIRKKLEEGVGDLERGRPVHWVLRRSGTLPHMFVSLVETGERSGDLERMLRVLGDLYRQEALRTINLWVRLAEPVAILVIGVVVGIIVLSVILPLTEVTSGIGR